ncbi:MAG: iron-regulated protein [Bacteroidetes bacterium]|nr:MAG: iron-regulated protein [Bacteroidota bacterium]
MDVIWSGLRLCLLAGLLLSSSATMAQKKLAYALYDGATGKPLSYKKALKHLAKAEVVCFGELHNNAIAHWLQYEVLSDLLANRDTTQVRVGAEMFETDQQAALDAYLAGETDRKGFHEATKLWPNYDTDYDPVVRLCQEAGIPVIATNVPRRLAQQVARQGPESLDTLSSADKALLVPLPYPIDYDLPSYAAMRDMMGGHGGGMNMDFFIAAQAVKDATMAHFILKHLPENGFFYHLNGSYHSDSKEGIVWYLRQARPELRVANLTVVEQADVSKPEAEHLGKADILIVVPETMTKTY